MTKSIKLSTITAIAVFSLIGCGSSSSSSDVKTGTGYYIDAAVSGLTYICGQETGTTNTDGKFTFEVGQSCIFKVGNIELPVVEASELKDGAKFVEDDAKTTQFLQSLDNADDGKITISPELIALLDKKDLVTVPKDATALETLIKSIEEEAKTDEAFTFTGHYVTPEEAVAHVEETKENIKAETAAEGRKFIFPSDFYTDVELGDEYYDGKNQKKFEAEKFVFSADRKFTFSELEFKDGAFVLDEDDNDDDDSKDYHLENGKWVEESDDNTIETVVSANDTVVTLDNFYRLTFSKVKDLENKTIKAIEGSDIEVTMPKGAEKIELGFEVLKDDYEIHEKSSSYNSLSEVVEKQCDTSYFQHAKNDSGIKGIAFTCGQEEQTSGTLVGVKNDNSLVTTGVGTWEIKNLPNSDIKALLVTIDAKYNEHSDSPMYAIKDGEVWRGYSDIASKKDPIVAYNQVAFDAITAKIVEVEGGTSTSTPINNGISL